LVYPFKVNKYCYFWGAKLTFQMKKIIAIVFGLVLSLSCFSQQSYDSTTSLLDQKALLYPTLNSKVDISVSEVSLDEFLRAIAVSNSVNLDIADNLKFPVVNNFTGVTVKDMLAFLCKQYGLTIEFTGNIISIRKELSIKKPYIPEALELQFEPDSQLITFNFKNDSLKYIAEQITKVTNKNVVLAPQLIDKVASAYIQNKTLHSALDKLAFANNLIVTLTDDGYFLLEPKVVESLKVEDNNENTRSSRRNSGESANKGSQNDKESIQINKVDFDHINIVAENYPMDELIKKVSEELHKSFFIVTKLEDKTNINLENATYDQLLNHIFAGSKFTYKKTDKYYVIGDRSAGEIKESRVISLKNRAVNKMLESIPEDIYADLKVKEFLEMNSLLVYGNQMLVDEFEKFIVSIDQTVPVILIEVMIVYVNKNKSISTGIDAGIGDAPVTTGGTINPGLDMTLGTNTINNIINSFNGFGVLNLSSVDPNFYMHLKALEGQGFLDIKSTPRLSTLNGHEASMSIGNKEYYQEEQTQIIGTQNPQTNTTTTYKDVTADLSVKILPIVSGAENITMEITVSQSDFTEKISKFAPPNTVNRKFESLIRVKNGEMILLGGLEEAEKSESSSGWPILSRIPIVKWVFSSRSKKDSKSKLTVFIKPTIIP
jgi:type IV pilus assembly protein PilQ